MRGEPVECPGLKLAVRLYASLVVWAVFGLNASVATTVQPPTFEALVNDADYIIRAITKSVQAEKRANARGHRIITRVELEVIEPVVGSVPQVVTLELWGGQVGDERLVVEGVPVFRVGEESVLFVKDNGHSICPLVGMMHGRYAIEKDRETGRSRVLRNDGLPLRSTSDVAVPNREIALDETSRQAALRVAMDASEFIQQIKAVAARRNREQ